MNNQAKVKRAKYSLKSVRYEGLNILVQISVVNYEIDVLGSYHLQLD